MQLYGGIEAGGTKFVCMVACQIRINIIAETKIPTTTPRRNDPDEPMISFHHLLKRGSWPPVGIGLIRSGGSQPKFTNLWIHHWQHPNRTGVLRIYWAE